MRNDFAVFIITHGRPNNQKTVAELQRLKYSGKLYLVIDDEDDTEQQYRDIWGNSMILQFNKEAFVQSTDTGLHEPIRKFAVYARNAVESFAKQLGYKYFMVLDDDIVKIRVRLPIDGSLKSLSAVGVIDNLLDGCIEYMQTSNIACLGLGFCNVYRSGLARWGKETSRQRFCAEAFIRNAEYTVNWRLNMIEDLITSLDEGVKGDVWLQFLPIQVDITMSEGKIEGGNSDAYNEFGRFKLSFFPIIAYPSCNTTRFVHNRWVTTTVAVDSVPKILSGKYRKES